MLVSRSRILLIVQQDLINLCNRRYRYKPKWAVQLKAKSICQKALDHFDAFYKPVYGDLWPPTRLSLLSLPKHCALVNKYTDVNRVASRLEGLGCLDFLQTLRDGKIPIEPTASSFSDYYTQRHAAIGFEEDLSDDVNPDRHSTSDIDWENTSEYELRKKKGPSEFKYVLSADSLESYDEDLYKSDLDAFVPPDRILSEQEKRVQEEVDAVSFQSRDICVEIIPMEPISVPENLRAFAFPRTDVSRFPQPKVYNQRTGYYLMDAGSILPVIALNLNPSDRVLDLCAAPGGKSLAIVQALDLEEGAVLHCNDVSSGRLVRLKNTMSSYLPHNTLSRIQISQMDGVSYLSDSFDKILVDVPCNSDRHVVTEEENNLFKQSRTRERLELMRRQTDLLVSAAKLCRVGGSIVYSTCTLAPGQNDGVIQAAVEALHETTQIKVAVEDLTSVSIAFQEHFDFFDRCRFGQLVLPSLKQNFGPTYFAKLRRIR